MDDFEAQFALMKEAVQNDDLASMRTQFKESTKRRKQLEDADLKKR